MHNYKELKIWKKAMELATQVYAITRSFPKEEQFGLTQQIRRAVVSVSSNIAEGAGRKSDKEFQYFLNISYGSLYELETQLLISKNLNYVSIETLKPLEDEITEIQKMIYVLIKNLETVKV